MKADWELHLCPGECGHVHRDCCDSVIGGEHQSACAETLERMRRILLRPDAPESDGPDPSRPAGVLTADREVHTP